MTEYMCSNCRYRFQQKESAIKHLNKKKSCGTGEKRVIEIQGSIKCNGCYKDFSTKKSLDHHRKYKCSSINADIKQEIEGLKTEIEDLKRREIENLKKREIEDLKSCEEDKTVLNNYKDTDLSKLSDKEMYLLIKYSKANELLIKFIEKLHFNKNIPENHNVYISDIKNKYIKVYRNDRWELMFRETELDNIIIDREYDICMWINTNSEKFPDLSEKITEYFEEKEPGQKRVIELIMYNNRDMIQKNN